MESLAYSASIGGKNGLAHSNLKPLPLRQQSELASLAFTLALGLMPTPAQASISQGDRCDGVADLQIALQDAGFNPGEIDGVFGANTRLAVQEFQYYHGLVEDGVVGANTAIALGFSPEMYCGSTAVSTATSPIGNGTTAWVQTEGSPLNVRSGPGVDYSLVTSLPNGSAVSLATGAEHDWVQLSEGGWVAAAWLTFEPQSSETFSTFTDYSPETIAAASSYTTYRILPGWTIEDIAYYLEDLGFFSADRFLAAASEIPTHLFPWLPGDLYSLEGFLYPDTYEIASGASPYEVIDQMLTRFETIALAAYQDSPTQLSVKDWVTLASIVEREAMLYEEQPVIAGVFLNRLYNGMRLESDPTVEYALGIQQTPEAPLTLSEVRTDSPYNTYLNSGLPPAPIASPGLGSLDAVLYPAHTDYLFFVACYDGTHEFNYTLEDHENDRDTFCSFSRGS